MHVVQVGATPLHVAAACSPPAATMLAAALSGCMAAADEPAAVSERVRRLLTTTDVVRGANSTQRGVKHAACAYHTREAGLRGASTRVV